MYMPQNRSLIIFGMFCDRLCVSAEQFYSQREVTCNSTASHIREMGQQCLSKVEIKYSEPLCVADKTCAKT